MNGKRFFGLAGVILLAMSALMAQSKGVAVTVEFKGDGEVNAEHPIWVFVWNSADFSNSIPIGAKTLTSNASVAEFAGVSASPIYITVAYDEKGGYNPQAVGAPPTGTPVSAYLVPGDNAPSALTLKEDGMTEVRIAFDGTFRMP